MVVGWEMVYKMYCVSSSFVGIDPTYFQSAILYKKICNLYVQVNVFAPF
jgi:hypothetical protein